MTETLPANITVQTAPPLPETPQIAERVWKAWIENNEKRDKVKFARRLRITVIVAALIGVAALVINF